MASATISAARKRSAVDSAESPTEWIDSKASMLAPHVPEQLQTYVSNQTRDLASTVIRRRAQILAELDAGGAEWDRALRPPPCPEELRSFSGSFETTWDTLGQDLAETGDGSMQERVGDVVTDADQVGAVAGFRQTTTAFGEALFRIWLGPLPDGRFGLLDIRMPLEKVAAGTVELDAGEAIASYGVFDTATSAYQLVGYVFGGQITFAQADATAGAPIQATVDGSVAMFVLP